MEMNELIAAIGVSVQKAQQTIEANGIDQFLSYFEEKEIRAKGNKAVLGQEKEENERALIPRTCKVILPGENGEDIIEVPLITMLHHKSLKLDEARIKLNVKTQLIGDQINVEVDQIASNEEGLGCDRQQIELVFKSGEPAEGVARINQSANKFL